MSFLDTNIIIRFLTGDDVKKQAACASLFYQIEAGTLDVFVPDIVIAEAVHVLASPKLYNHSRSEVAALLIPLLHLPHLETQNKRILLRTLHIYADTKNLDFADACLIATMEQTKSDHLFSYDTDFNQFPFIKREEPAIQ